VTHQVSGRTEVIINGAEALAKLTPAIQEMVTAQVEDAIKRTFKEKLPDA
jgi:hypothetical protein